MRIFIAIIASFLLSTAATAESVWQCIDQGGKKTWSNVECPQNTTGELRDIKANNILNSQGLRNWSRNNPERYKPENNNQAGLKNAEWQEKKQRCENAKLDYSFESTWKSHKANPETKRQIMIRECSGL